jgi:hypothetical protein
MIATTMVHCDDETRRDALDELAWDARLRPSEIGVPVVNGCGDAGRRGVLCHERPRAHAATRTP